MLPTEFAQYAVVAVASLSALSIVSAIARRIAGPSGSRRLAAEAMRARFGGKPEPGVERELGALRDEVEHLRGEVAALHSRSAELDDMQNRLDFAERMLAQVRDKTALPGPR